MTDVVNDSDEPVHVPGAAFVPVARCSGCASEALDARSLRSADGRTTLCGECFAVALDAVAARAVANQVVESPPIASPVDVVKSVVDAAPVAAPGANWAPTGPCRHRYLSPTGDIVSLASARAVKARCVLCNEAAA